MGKREARKTQVAPIFPLGRLGWGPATQDPWGSRSTVSSPNSLSRWTLELYGEELQKEAGLGTGWHRLEETLG